MAAGAGGIGQLIMSALQNKTATGGGQPGQTMPGAGGDTTGADYSQQVAELKGADPGMLLRQVKQMKQICAVLMVQNLERLPNVAGQLSKIIPQFDRVIKEIQQAANTATAVRNPIGMGAAQPPMDTGGM